VPDFDFVGPAYEAPSLTQDAQELINWYIEADPTKAQGARGRFALYPTPGLTTLCTPAVGEVRGLGVSPDGSQMIAIIGSSVYLISSTYSATLLGSMATASGPVNITDNSASAYWVDASARYYYTWASGTFAQLPSTDGTWQGGTRADVCDGFILYGNPTPTQAYSATYPYGSSIDSTGRTSPAGVFGVKSGSGDLLQCLIVNNRLVYLLGSRSSEVWTNSGASAFSFTLVPGTSTQTGVIAPNSVAGFGQPPEQTFCFLGQSDTGAGVVYQAAGFNFNRISTHAVENDIQKGVLTDALAYSMQIGGHVWYVLVFPTQDKTWAYDDTTKQWHKWLSWDSGFYHRHRLQCTAYFQGQVVGGDFANGKIYRVSTDVFTDAGATIRRLRRAPHLVSDLKQVAYQGLQVHFQPGVGLTTGQGSNPQAMLRWSDDGGFTWSNEHWVSIGAQGRYKNRAFWQRLGTARDRIFEVVVSDPIYAVMVSAELDAQAGAH
jgi:hypothetical protein